MTDVPMRAAESGQKNPTEWQALDTTRMQSINGFPHVSSSWSAIVQSGQGCFMIGAGRMSSSAKRGLLSHESSQRENE